METPLSSARRVTRSMTSAARNSSNGKIPVPCKFEESERSVTRTRQRCCVQQQDRSASALIDITNDSPIVGLAMGKLETPSSTMSKKRISSQSKYTCTPGSGEALLRGQAKNLLQKVEEEAEFSKISLEKGPFFNLKCFLNSPMNLLAPTLANTPQILNSDLLHSATHAPPQCNSVISQDATDGKKEEGTETENEKDLITRALDFSEISDSTDSSVVTYNASRTKKHLFTDEDDASSIWSIRVNASSTGDEEEEEEEFEDDYHYEDEEKYKNEDEYKEGEGEEDEQIVDDLCEGMRKISVAKCGGKHTRFVYNSEGELEGEEIVCVSKGENL